MNIPHFIQSNISLKHYNWFELGGNAKYIAYLHNMVEFTACINFGLSQDLPIKILGLGANVLIADEGFSGLIIQLPKKKITYTYINNSEGILTADAGCTIADLIMYCLDTAFLFGLEEFSGIPSTVGGALFINLHYFQYLISQFVYSAVIFDKDTNTMLTVDKNWFEFDYDSSKVKHNSRYIILEASFILKRNTALYAEYAKGRRIEIIRHRENRYPYQKTCGCFFKNFNTTEVPSSLEGKKIVAAGYYLEKIGVRGELKINHVSVSSRHANMIIHNGQGTANDVIAIAKEMQKKVFQRYGLLLEPECELIGFKTYPLYTLDTIQ